MFLPRLFRPREAFADAEPDLRASAAVVLLAAVATAVSVSLVAAPLAAAVDGTASVPNPDHLSGPMCEDRLFEEFETPTGCAEPTRIEVDLASYARSGVGALVVPSFVAVLGAWPVVTAWTHAFAADPDRDSIAETADAVGWAFLPLVVPAVARVLLLYRRADQYVYPDTTAGVRDAARDLAVGTGSTLAFGVAALAFCWSTYVLVSAFRARHSASWIRLGAFVVGPAVLTVAASFALGAAAAAPAVGAILLAVGVPSALLPRAMIRIEKWDDLIGMKGHVEPEDWYVGLHRYGGGVAVAVGYFLAGGPAFLI